MQSNNAIFNTQVIVLIKIRQIDITNVTFRDCLKPVYMSSSELLCVVN